MKSEIMAWWSDLSDHERAGFTTLGIIAAGITIFVAGIHAGKALYVTANVFGIA